MQPERVDITGLGAVSCCGDGVAPYSDTVLSGRCCIGPIEDIISGIRFSTGAPVRSFDPSRYFDARDLGFLDRFSQFAAVAARQAWSQAGLDQAKPDPSRVAVVIGTANGGIDIIDEGYRRQLLDNARPKPLTVPMNMSSAPASRIAREIGAHGPVFGVTSACASSAHAMLLAHMLIRMGHVDVAVAGGTDSCFSDGYLRAWDALRVVSPDTCRPFSKERAGLILGEGAGMFVLEREGRAAARGQAIVGGFLGGGMSCDAGDLLAPDPDGMSTAMTLALADTGLAASQIDYVNAHGTGTPANDRAEARAVNTVFGRRGTPLPVSSTKSMIGHALGAAGALEGIATVSALNAGIIPPTMNYTTPDPDCDIDPVPNAPRQANIAVGMSNSFAFGGLNVSLVFTRGDWKGGTA